MNETYLLTLSPFDPRRVNAVGLDGKNKFGLIVVGNVPLSRRLIPIPRRRISLVEVFHFAKENYFAIYQVEPY